MKKQPYTSAILPDFEEQGERSIAAQFTCPARVRARAITFDPIPYNPVHITRLLSVYSYPYHSRCDAVYTVRETLSLFLCHSANDESYIAGLCARHSYKFFFGSRSTQGTQSMASPCGCRCCYLALFSNCSKLSVRVWASKEEKKRRETGQRRETERNKMTNVNGMRIYLCSSRVCVCVRAVPPFSASFRKFKFYIALYITHLHGLLFHSQIMRRYYQQFHLFFSGDNEHETRFSSRIVRGTWEQNYYSAHMQGCITGRREEVQCIAFTFSSVRYC